MRIEPGLHAVLEPDTINGRSDRMVSRALPTEPTEEKSQTPLDVVAVCADVHATDDMEVRRGRFEHIRLSPFHVHVEKINPVERCEQRRETDGPDAAHPAAEEQPAEIASATDEPLPVIAVRVTGLEERVPVVRCDSGVEEQRLVVDVVVAEMLIHPRETGDLSLNTDESYRKAALPRCESSVDQPPAVTRPELDHREATIGTSHGFEDVDPLEHVFARLRVARRPARVVVLGDVVSAAARANPVRLKSGTMLAVPTSERFEDRVRCIHASTLRLSKVAYR
jgi:hypothetical protein